jgi:dolichyl-phosphate beta-glucosyltransferase
MLRRTIERKGYRHYVGRVFATLFSVILDYPVYDTQCGAKLFRVTENIRSVFADPFLTRWLFDVEILARLADICGAGARLDGLVREEPLAFWRHVEGSKIGIQDTLHVLAETYRLWRHYKR